MERVIFASMPPEQLGNLDDLLRRAAIELKRIQANGGGFCLVLDPQSYQDYIKKTGWSAVDTRPLHLRTWPKEPPAFEGVSVYEDSTMTRRGYRWEGSPPPTRD